VTIGANTSINTKLMNHLRQNLCLTQLYAVPENHIVSNVHPIFLSHDNHNRPSQDEGDVLHGRKAGRTRVHVGELLEV
jgi:hypothetical protein